MHTAAENADVHTVQNTPAQHGCGAINYFQNKTKNPYLSPGEVEIKVVKMLKSIHCTYLRKLINLRIQKKTPSSSPPGEMVTQIVVVVIRSSHLHHCKYMYLIVLILINILIKQNLKK